MSRRPTRALLAALLLLLPAPALAQVRPSEDATVSQTVDGAHVTVAYSRPVARGRPNLFGGVVRWGSTWTPGANWATTLEVDRDVKVNGSALPAGKYSVWMVPRQQGDWSVIFSRSVRRFHTNPPDASDEALRLSVRPETVPHTEVLTWSFPLVGGDTTVLQMQWGTTAIPLHLDVAPSASPQPRGEERATFSSRSRKRLDAAEPAAVAASVLHSNR